MMPEVLLSRSRSPKSFRDDMSSSFECGREAANQLVGKGRLPERVTGLCWLSDCGKIGVDAW